MPDKGHASHRNRPLTDQQATILILYDSGWSYAEIVRELKIRRQTVRNQLDFAKAKQIQRS